METALLQVEDLHVSYRAEHGVVHAVAGVTFDVRGGERFGIVGESGCGKSTTAMTILRLIKPPAYVERGRILLGNENLLALDEPAMRRHRWSTISLVMQGAMNSLSPVTRVRQQIADAIITHEGKAAARTVDQRITELLGVVGLPPRVAGLFPHELSGGMKQRVCIAMAIVLRPRLIVADEPTSALDVVTQRVVVQTLIEVQERIGASLILIGHDMGLQAQIVQRMAVMYAGHIVEIGTVDQIYDDPLHPYTQLLIESIPSVREHKMPKGIPGLPPSLLHPPPGCLFRDRCPKAMEVCRGIFPPLREVQPGHWAACYLYP